MPNGLALEAGTGFVAAMRDPFLIHMVMHDALPSACGLRSEPGCVDARGRGDERLEVRYSFVLYSGQCISVGGPDGGNTRHVYATFLDDVAEGDEPDGNGGDPSQYGCDLENHCGLVQLTKT